MKIFKKAITIILVFVICFVCGCINNNKSNDITISDFYNNYEEYYNKAQGKNYIEPMKISYYDTDLARYSDERMMFDFEKEITEEYALQIAMAHIRAASENYFRDPTLYDCKYLEDINAYLIYFYKLWRNQARTKNSQFYNKDDFEIVISKEDGSIVKYGREIRYY